MRSSGLRSVVAACGLAAVVSGPARAEAIPFIDTHAHLEHLGGDLANFPRAAEMALEQMRRNGISFSLLMPPPNRADANGLHDVESLVQFVKKHPDKFGLIGGGGSLNPMIHATDHKRVSDRDKAKFRKLAEDILAAGALGFGEIAVTHFHLQQMGAHHPFETVPADHPLLLLLMDIAAEKNVPVDIHFDVSPENRPVPEHLLQGNPNELKENLSAFERLLAHNRNARVVWAHAGSDPGLARTPLLTRRLLTAHPNLYMSLRQSAGKPAPALAMKQDGSLKEPWLALLRDFPDRFVIGSDQFHPPFEGGRRTTRENIDRLRLLVNSLPPDVAGKVAHENARRIYRLP